MSNDPVVELCRMLVALQDDLRDAAQLANVRHRMIKSVGAVTSFVEKCAPNENLFAPFHQLEVALCDLEKGNVADFLQPKKNPSRHEKRLAEKLIVAHAVYYTDVLMGSGMSLERAARFVAVELQRHGQLRLGRSEPWKTVKAWRDELSRPSASAEIVSVVKAFREGHVAIETRDESQAKRYVAAHLSAQLVYLQLV